MVTWNASGRWSRRSSGLGLEVQKSAIAALVAIVLNVRYEFIPGGAQNNTGGNESLGIGFRYRCNPTHGKNDCTDGVLTRGIRIPETEIFEVGDGKRELVGDSGDGDWVSAGVLMQVMGRAIAPRHEKAMALYKKAQEKLEK